MAEDKAKIELRTVSWNEFLANVPPTEPVAVNNLRENHAGSLYLEMPDPELICSDPCNGPRMFSSTEGGLRAPRGGSSHDQFIVYKCRNCGTCAHTFAVCVMRPTGRIVVMKYGQLPPFGPLIPGRLQKLLKDDRELFLKGVRAESQGLGIGAFGYYRRVVERQKDRLFDQIISVAKAEGLGTDRIEKLAAAKRSFSFKGEVKEFKPLIPDSVLIKGHNPLTLLHAILSDGLHDLPDAECLDRAQDIREVLAEFARRAAEALKDTKELDAAVRRISQRRAPARATIRPPDGTPPNDSRDG